MKHDIAMICEHCGSEDVVRRSSYLYARLPVARKARGAEFWTIDHHEGGWRWIRHATPGTCGLGETEVVALFSERRAGLFRRVVERKR